MSILRIHLCCSEVSGSPLVLILQGLKKSRLPHKLQMVVLCNRPNFEFRAFQVSLKNVPLISRNITSLILTQVLIAVPP